MAIQFNRSNPAISRFNAGMQAGDNMRAREEEAFEKRRGREQAQGVDTALREGIGSFYAGQGPAAPAEPVQPPVQVTPPIIPTQPGVPMAPQDVTGSPNELPGGDVAIASQTAPFATPAPANTAGAPAISRVQAGGGAGDRSNAMMQRLAQTPGAGQTMNTMHGAEQTRKQQDQRLRQQAEIQVIRALHNGEGQVAAAIASHYQINIPPELIESQSFQGEMKQVGASIKGMGINDDTMAAQITLHYLNARKGGADQQTALTTALEQAKGPATKGKGPKRIWSDRLGTWVEEPTEEAPTGRTMAPPGASPRPAGSGRGGAGGGGETGTQKNWKTAAQAYIDAGYDPKVARLMAVNKGFAVTPQLVQRQAQHIMNSAKDMRGRSTVTYENAMERAQRMLTSIPVAPGVAPPQPASAPAPANRPPLSSFEKR